jgi:RecT family
VNEIEPYRPSAHVDSWVPVLGSVGELASRIATTSFVPKALRGKVPETAACILYGRELGLPPMRALNEIHVIEGTPSLSSTAMRALVFAGGHNIVVDHWDDQRCTVSGWRKGQTEPAAQVTYTMADAQRAGLHQRGPWKQHPRSMLLARATSELCRAVFPDVIGGLQLADDAMPATEPAPSQIRRRPIPALPEQRNGQPEPDRPAPPEPASRTPESQPGQEDQPPTDAGPQAPTVEDIPAPPTTRQMRMLHAILRGAGHTTDEAVHAELSRALERDVVSRRELTREEVGRLLDRPELLKGNGNG